MKSILESISDGVFTVDESWKITYFNRAAELITGIQREEACGKYCFDVFKAGMCEQNCALRTTMETGEPVINKGTWIHRGDGEKTLITVSTALLKNEAGEVVGGAETFRHLPVSSEWDIGGNADEKVVFRSPLMRRILEPLPQIAASSATILLLGSTGTGKSMLARMIHEMSPRRYAPLVELNCGALPEHLVESELFGYKKGAFTGAEKDHPGRCGQAQGGTLFLDEVGELPLQAQGRLLKLLQEKCYEPLGSPRTLKADIRFIAATNRNLKEEVEAGRFREDLFYRLNVFSMELPSLEQRRADLPGLISQLTRRLCHRYEKEVLGIEPEVYSLLLQKEYPGNVRELENILEYAVVLCDKNTISVAHLPHYVRDSVSSPSLSVKGGELEEASRTAESERIISVLKKNHYSCSKSANELGIHRTTLYRKMMRYGIKRSS